MRRDCRGEVGVYEVISLAVVGFRRFEACISPFPPLIRSNLPCLAGYIAKNSTYSCNSCLLQISKGLVPHLLASSGSKQCFHTPILLITNSALL